MRKFAGALAGLLVPAFVVAGVFATPAMAQGKKTEMAAASASLKEYASDDKARAYVVTYKPGGGRDITPGHRVVRALKGGTLERTHPDGKKERVEWKAGEVRINKPTQPYKIKNVGKSEVQLYVVELK